MAVYYTTISLTLHASGSNVKYLIIIMPIDGSDGVIWDRKMFYIIECIIYGCTVAGNAVKVLMTLFTDQLQIHKLM